MALSVTLSTMSLNPVNGQYVVQATFDQAVNFSSTNVTLVNAQISNFTTSDNINYFFTMNPVASGATSSRILANAASAVTDSLIKNSDSNILSRNYVPYLDPNYGSSGIFTNSHIKLKAGKSIDFNFQPAINLPPPSLASDLVTKSYVDSIVPVGGGASSPLNLDGGTATLINNTTTLLDGGGA